MLVRYARYDGGGLRLNDLILGLCLGAANLTLGLSSGPLSDCPLDDSARGRCEGWRELELAPWDCCHSAGQPVGGKFPP